MKVNIEYKEIIENEGVPISLLIDKIEKHQSKLPRYNKLDAYYNGKHDILIRDNKKDKTGKPNNKIVHNYPKYITNTIVGYQMGDALKYTLDQRTASDNTEDDSELIKLQDLIKRAKFSFYDDEIAKDMSVFGEANVLVYMSDDEKPEPRIALIDPRYSFIVTDDTMKNESLFSVQYFTRQIKEGNKTKDIYIVTVYTDKEIVHYEAESLDKEQFIIVNREINRFAKQPMIKYKNNEESIGDFEDIIPLIDALNTIQSDRTNSIEAAVDAILFLKNFTLPENADLSVSRIIEAFNVDNKDVDAKWLVNQLDQGDVEVLRKNLVEDIHKLSFVPSFTDEHFAGNQSGVALKYKLIGLEQLVKKKNRYMKFARLETIDVILSAKNNTINLDIEDLDIEFTYSLPTNELETAEIVEKLQGIVPNEYLLGLLHFIKDPKAVAEQVEEERLTRLNDEASLMNLPFQNPFIDENLNLDFADNR